MTNHVHLLCTPSNVNGISQMMQSLGRMYVMYFNRSYKRTGTLWEDGLNPIYYKKKLT
ncbi:MAG: transposase [Paraglaciecola sp.]|uniref:transposase n=1 Tax=Paraglaciecola sp. TaxID=1920173 RepID=UPI0032978779